MIDKNHPRYDSLMLREKIKEAFKEGYLADSGMIAHGRGEAFDYLLGEKTTSFSYQAIEVSIASLLLAENPVISVNGNTVALVGDELITLAKTLNAKIEVNLFYRTKKRVELIKNIFKEKNFKVLGTDDENLMYIDKIQSPRATADKNGIYKADVVLVSLEDGDRAKILSDSGKKVIAIDLNPLSRTSITADITIVDNIMRAIPLMIEIAKKFKNKDKNFLENIIANFSNKGNLKSSLNCMELNKDNYN